MKTVVISPEFLWKNMHCFLIKKYLEKVYFKFVLHLQKLYIYTRKSQLYGDVLVSLEGVGVVDTLLLSNNPEGEPTFFNHLMNFELFFW